MTLGTGLGFDLLDISIIVLDLSGSRGLNLVHTPTAGGALAFKHTAFLTVALTLVTDVRNLLVEESHTFHVIRAFLLTETDHLSNFLLLAFSIFSTFGIVIRNFQSTTGVPDLVHSFIIGHISGFFVALSGT
jgi:hypothetical protein